MATASEQVIYRSPEVVITNARCMFGGTTYATANVSSVRMGSESKAGIYILFGILAILIALGGFANQSFGTGVIALLIGIGLFYASRFATTYFVVIHTNSGEIRAFRSSDVRQVQGLVEGINNAIVHRG